jgi:beta-lactamase regulating signal transducer with metallopeptidase domain
MSPWAELAWAQVWQVTLVAAGIGIFNGLFCRRRPHLAHLLWLVVLVKCLTPPLWSSPTGVFSWASRAETVAPTIPAKVDTRVAPPTSAYDQAGVGERGFDATMTAPASETVAVGPVGKADAQAGVPQRRLPVEFALLIIWLAGAAAYGGFALVATLRWWRSFRSNRIPAGEPLARLVEGMARRLGVRRHVNLWLSRQPLGPLTVGWIRPAIVMPDALAASRSEAEIELLLAHELIHVRRGDVLIGLLQIVVQSLWWFHPLIWWANHRIVCERERCCDEEVVAGLACQPARYARMLLTILEMKRQLRWPTALPGARRFEITRQRLERIMIDGSRFHERMPRGYWLVLLAAGLLVLPGAGFGRTGKQAGEDQPRSGAALTKAVYDNFNRVERFRNFRIRTKSKTTYTDEGRHWAERMNAYGSKPNTNPQHSDAEWAWNETGVFHRTEYRFEGSNAVQQDTLVWDGTLAIDHSRISNDRYTIGNKASQVFNDHLVRHIAQLPWGPNFTHDFWWAPTDVAKHRQDWHMAPEHFELMGEEEVNGRRCHVLVSRTGHHRMHVGVADGRLYRHAWLSPWKAAGFDQLALCRRIGGQAFRTRFHWDAWLKNLQPLERQRAWREYQVAAYEFARPSNQHTFEDYREVAPGCWLPFRHTFDRYDLETPNAPLVAHTEQTVTEVAVDQPVPQELFRIELNEGIHVDDARYQPLISYAYRRDQTEAERVALCEAEKQKRAKEEEKHYGVIKSRMGMAPPALPQSGWLNGGPFTWEQLRGKIVVLHSLKFTDEHELAHLTIWHENAEGHQITVIGIHPPTDDAAAVSKKLEDLGVKYPVAIDIPSADSGGNGVLHDWLGIASMHQTVLLNRRGQVAGHGRWFFNGTVPEQIRQLAAEKE